MIIVDYLRQMILEQINRERLVTVFDPEKHYQAIWPELMDGLPEDVHTAQYDGSFFQLRHDIEPLLAAADDVPPRLLVYVPLAESETQDALCELQLAGKVMRPAQQPKERNIKLSLVVRDALLKTGNWTKEDAAKVERDVDAGKFADIAEIETIARRNSAADSILQLIFGTNEPGEVALLFLDKSTFDASLQEKQALPELLHLIQAFGTPPSGYPELSTATAAEIRKALARHLLASDFVANWQGALPAFVSSYDALVETPALKAAANVAQQWRARRDFYQSYETFANELEDTWKVASLPHADWQQAQHSHVFKSMERLLQNGVVQALCEAQTEAEMQQRIDFIQERKSGFWPQYEPEIMPRWELLQALGRVLMTAHRVEREVQNAPEDAAIFWGYYTQGETSWSELDAAHRRMERLFHRIDSEENWLPLVHRCRSNYTRSIGKMASSWNKAWKTSNYEVPGTPAQRCTWNSAVAPLLKQKHKTAYVLVDALRYEMACELKSALSQEFKTELTSAVGTLPGITKIGMAALMPGAEQLQLDVSGKVLFASIDNIPLKDRNSRMRFLKENAALPEAAIVEVALDKLLPQPKKALRDAIKKAKLIVLTSQEIDALCEGDNVPLARRTMDDMLGELQRAFRILQNLDVTHIVVTADHGFLFGEELGDDMKIDAPGGQEIELHRRVWLGRGGKEESTFIRESLNAFTPTNDATAEIAVPAGVGVFRKQGGAQAYFHGGASLQELAIPLLQLQTSAKSHRDDSIKWQCSLNTQKLTTPFLSVQVAGQSQSLLETEVPKVALKVLHGSEPIKAQTVSATYGLEASDEVQLRWEGGRSQSIEHCTLALMFEHDDLAKLNGEAIDIVLYDVQTNAELAKAAALKIDVLI